jgi:hypothetical protein
LVKRLEKDMKSDNSTTSKLKGGFISLWERASTGLVTRTGIKRISGKGASYEGPVPGGGIFRFIRGNETAKTPNFFRSVSGYGADDGPLSFHNQVELILPSSATAEDVAKAIESLGVVDQVRPALPSDVKGVVENKMIRLFATKNDGTKNYTGELRAQALEAIKNRYNFTADDIEISASTQPGARGRIDFLLPRRVAEQIANDTGARAFVHRWHDNGWQKGYTLENKADMLVDVLTGSSLLSTVQRWNEGIYVSGSSSTSDIKGVGAEFVFTSKKTSTPADLEKDSARMSASDLAFWFDGLSILRRMDYYANLGDGWGQVEENKNFVDEILTKDAYEVLFKKNLTWADLSGIAVSSELRALVLQKLKDRGITEIGGMSPEDILNPNGVVKPNPPTT